MALVLGFARQSWGGVLAYIPVSILIACIAAVIATTLTRARGFRNAVRVRRWTWLGNNSPWDLPFREIFNEPDEDAEFKNVFSGTQKGLEFVAFDCIFGSGRYRRFTSAVAVRSAHNPFGTELFGDASIVQCGEWWAIHAGNSFEPSHRIGVAETVAIIESIVSAETA